MGEFAEFHDELRSVAGELLAKDREVDWAVLVDAGLESLITRQNTRVIDHLEREHVPYVDLLPALIERDAHEAVYFVDDSHTNAIGHRVIAERVTDAVAQRLAILAQDIGCFRD